MHPLAWLCPFTFEALPVAIVRPAATWDDESAEPWTDDATETMEALEEREELAHVGEE